MSETERDRRQRDPAPEGRGGGPSTDGGSSPGGPGPDGADATGTSRRDFLKILGISGAGAATAACTPPETTDKLLPQLVQEKDVEPGENVTYSTVLARGGPEPLGLHAWVRDGRTINVQGNPDFPTNGERVSALGLSALQDLYDPDRFRGPRRRSGGELAEASWEDALTAASEAVGSGSAVLLTGPASGTRGRFLREWAEATGVEHLAWEPLHHEVQREASRRVFGRAEIPDYALERSDRIVSFGADFLGTWLAPVELAGRFARAREVDEGRYAELTFVGPRLSVTGTSADEWIRARSGTEGLVALAAARLVAEARGGAAARQVRELLVPFTPDRVAERSGVPAERIRALAESLAAAERPVALPPGPEGRGPAATDAHVAVALLNQVAGAVGETVRFGAGPLRGRPATLEALADLAERLRSGEVSTLLVADADPVYSVPASVGFGEAVENATVIALDGHPTDTAARADWVLPVHHELESWGDAEVRPGVWALAQPTMRPVFDTRPLEDVLMRLASAGGVDPVDAFGADAWSAYLQDAWREKHDSVGAPGSFEDWWEAALKRGGWWGAAPDPAGAPGLASGVAGHDFDFPDGGGDGEGFALVPFPTPQLYDGRGANRGWMQELPDPVSKIVWNSWVEMHPETAEPLGLEDGDVVELRSEAGTVRAPVKLYRGVRPDTVAVPMGQGHEAYGRNAEGRGVNVLDLLPARTEGRTGALALAGTTVRVTATGERERLVDAQGSDTDLGRDVAKMLGLGEARDRIEAHEVDLAEMVEAAWDSDPKSPYRWGMTIDLNACTGCGACVTACYAENNLPVVGEEKFAQGREMSWLRIERYYQETADGGFQTTHEPMLCQHCGDAPCEPVCPVYATYHNPEGLNVQVYNRCVGTRYCSNNCPYKVRRFNWFEYDFPYPLDMQLNPDVTVREKGVMEKCTFCVQRINRAKIEAKEQGRLVRDGEVTTACQGACPTDAIVFGNLKDPTSEVSQVAKGARSYHVLEELHTRPAVTYLEDVTAAELPEGGGHGGGHGASGNGDHGGHGADGAVENGGPPGNGSSGGGHEGGGASDGGAAGDRHAPAEG